MPIRYEKRITRAMLRDEPSTLFVFGDNLERRGFGGQAKEMRGEPNAVGIPTKRAPGMHPVDFFSDRDLDAYLDARAHDLMMLVRHLLNGGTVVLPADGIGTGRARLKQTAPAIWCQLQEDLRDLGATAEVTSPEPPHPDQRTGDWTMMALLQILFVGHVHKWQTIKEVRLSTGTGSIGTRYFQQCECCGKVIKRDLV